MLQEHNCPLGPVLALRAHQQEATVHNWTQSFCKRQWQKGLKEPACSFSPRKDTKFRNPKFGRIPWEWQCQQLLGPCFLNELIMVEQWLCGDSKGTLPSSALRTENFHTIKTWFACLCKGWRHCQVREGTVFLLYRETAFQLAGDH